VCLIDNGAVEKSLHLASDIQRPCGAICPWELLLFNLPTMALRIEPDFKKIQESILGSSLEQKKASS